MWPTYSENSVAERKTTRREGKKGRSHYEFIIYTIVKVHKYSGSTNAQLRLVTKTQVDTHILTTLPASDDGIKY